jgi:hypothetical protein
LATGQGGAHRAQGFRALQPAFTVATSTNPIIRLARTRLAPAVLPLAARANTGRAYAFRAISQLTINYRNSPLSTSGRIRAAAVPKPATACPTPHSPTTATTPPCTRSPPHPAGTCCCPAAAMLRRPRPHWRTDIHGCCTSITYSK